MNIVILSGSQRKNSLSQKIGELIIRHLEASNPDLSLTLMSLEAANLPLWDEQIGIDSSEMSAAWKPFQSRLQSCDGLVIISPEWSGMASPALKNFFLYCDNKVIAHKPALLVSVSAGLGGSYPISELRSSSYKNTRLNYIPEHVIVRHAESFHENFSNPKDAQSISLKTRLLASLSMLLCYSQTMKPAREQLNSLMQDFPNGM